MNQKKVQHKGKLLSVEEAAQSITLAGGGAQVMYRLIEALSRRLECEEVEYVLNLSPGSVTEEHDEAERVEVQESDVFKHIKFWAGGGTGSAWLVKMGVPREEAYWYNRRCALSGVALRDYLHDQVVMIQFAHPRNNEVMFARQSEIDAFPTPEAVAVTLTEKWVDVTVGLEELNRNAERFGRRFGEVNDE